MLAGLAVGVLLLPASALAERALAMARGLALESSRAAGNAVDFASASLELALDDANAHARQAAIEKIDPRLLAAGVRESAMALVADLHRVDEVTVTVEQALPVAVLAETYSLSPHELAALNPELDLDPADLDHDEPCVEPGQSLRIWRQSPQTPAASRGRPNRGRLVNGAPMPPGEHWVVRDPTTAWGTPFAVASIAAGLRATAARFENTPAVEIGDLSARYGGRLRPHRSHQSGRDVDIAYYRIGETAPLDFSVTRALTFDAPRQYFLLRFWVKSGAIERAFIDPRLTRAMLAWAQQQGESDAFLDLVFGDDRRGVSGIIGYSPGHDDHIHVRFRCTKADAACDDT